MRLSMVLILVLAMYVLAFASDTSEEKVSPAATPTPASPAAASPTETPPAVTTPTPATPTPAQPGPTPNGIELPVGYIDWRAISASTRSDNGTIRIILGNDAAVAAARTGKTKPWPDGAILCKLVWKQIPHEAWPTAGIPGDFDHVEFMVKDSKLYPSTGGWGFARWVGLEMKPYGSDSTFAQTCFACHKPRAKQDYVFTHPVSLPSSALR
jgi:hypothetical protein